MGLPSLILPSTWASACRRWRANRSARSGRKLGTVCPPGELVVGGVQVSLDGIGAEGVDELRCAAG